MDIEGLEPFTRTLRCVEQNPSVRRFKQVAIRLENPAAKGFVSRWCHRNEVFECSGQSVVYLYPIMLTLSRCLALRGEFCEYSKPLFYQ